MERTADAEDLEEGDRRAVGFVRKRAILCVCRKRGVENKNKTSKTVYKHVYDARA